MNVKENFSTRVDNALRPLDYRMVAPRLFCKGGAGFDYQVLLAFTGRVAIECRVHFGFCIREIDEKLSSTQIGKPQIGSGARNLATISVPLDVIARTAGAEVDYSIDLEKDWDAPIGRLVNGITATENMFVNLDDVASFAVRETSLALGHHAFRIPLLLQMTARDEDYAEYVNRVRATGFIPNYDSYLDETKRLDI